MDKKQVEDRVKEVLVSKLKHDEVAVNRAQEIARGVLESLSDHEDGTDCIDVLKEVSAKYEELASINESFEGDTVEVLIHEIADLMSHLIQEGHLDAALAMSAKVDESLSEDDGTVTSDLEQVKDTDFVAAVAATQAAQEAAKEVSEEATQETKQQAA